MLDKQRTRIMITIDEVRSIKDQYLTDGITPASGETLREVTELAISQHEEIERLRAELKEASGWLKYYRKTDADRWMDLKEKLKDAERERDEAYERAAQIADGFTCGGCGMDWKCSAAIRALKSGEPK